MTRTLHGLRAQAPRLAALGFVLLMLVAGFSSHATTAFDGDDSPAAADHTAHDCDGDPQLLWLPPRRVPPIFAVLGPACHALVAPPTLAFSRPPEVRAASSRGPPKG